jgi:hypothetical protein
MAARHPGNGRIETMSAKVHAPIDERACKDAKKKARQFPAGLPLIRLASRDQKLR